ncbi:hypothetical protein DB345_05915 [Spartobacteria bacterium LR76]|nr:hypothetical protein DB345_05915 [Spartobacteria bacterium LR76]
MSENPVIVDNLKWAYAPGEGLPVWIWVVTAVLLAAAGVATFLWFRQRKLAAVAAQPEPPAHEKALEALRRLQARLSEEREMDFIIEVSRILRVYIQDRFELRAPHRSTEEFLEEARISDALSPEYRELLGEFLRQCDLVKFARRSAALKKMEILFATAERFVHDTTPRPMAESTPAAA